MIKLLRILKGFFIRKRSQSPHSLRTYYELEGDI